MLDVVEEIRCLQKNHETVMQLRLGTLKRGCLKFDEEIRFDQNIMELVDVELGAPEKVNYNFSVENKLYHVRCYSNILGSRYWAKLLLSIQFVIEPFLGPYRDI